MAKKVTVTAELPKTVDLSIRGAANGLTVRVEIEGGKKGSLVIGSGSVAWWPQYNHVNAHSVPWAKLIDMLESVTAQKAVKKLTGPKSKGPA